MLVNCVLNLGKTINNKAIKKKILIVLFTGIYLGVVSITYGQQKELLEEPLVVDLKPFCPTPGQQGEVGACVGFAVGYGAMSILQAIEHHWTDAAIIKKQAFSASFIYNQFHRNSNHCKGSIRVEEALQLLKKKGNCPERLFPFTSNCRIQPDERQKNRALEYRIKEYDKIFGSTINDTTIVGEARVELVKKYLKDSIPVIIDFELYQCFKNLREGLQLWKKDSDIYEETHTMVVIGFDDQKRTFEVMNSWGEKWANKGFVKIEYDYFIKYCLGAYAILPNRHTNQFRKRLLPSFSFQGKVHLVSIQESVTGSVTENIPVYYDEANKMYQTIQPNFSLGTQFQLRFSEQKKEPYLYVFRCDEKGIPVLLHSPKTTLKQLEGVSSSPSNGSPNYGPEKRTFELNQLGTDYICILYSETELKDINNYLQQIKSYEKDDIIYNINNVFEEKMVSYTSIFYEKNSMYVKTKSNTKQGFVVPIVLKIQTVE